MSRIRRLSIRGIRNFGDESEEATIRFTRPLTLILGPNGTGKTTIIEALKFATSGEFPPGSDRGKLFVHDPNLAGTPHVKGAIKAEIIDLAGNIYTICRTIQCTQMRTKLQFKTLDNTLTRENKFSKKKASITSRCADVDTEVAEAMGVSKPILNYVIFCHQDELSWPLDEGQKLKKRFDEIFDSAKYNKAFEMITDQCKKMKVDLKVMKAEKESVEVIVSEVELKESKLEENKERLEEGKEKINVINQEIQPLIQKIQKIEEQEAEYKKLSTEYEKKSMEIGIMEKQIESLKEGIKEVYDGTVEKLEEQLSDYDNILVTKNSEIKECQEKLESITGDEAQTSNLLAQQKVTVGTLKQQLHDCEKKTILRNNSLNAALAAWKLDPASKDISEAEVVATIKNINEKLRNFEREVDENIVTNKQAEEKLQNTVDQLRSTRSKIESEVNLRDDEVAEIREQLSEIRAKITQVGQATTKLSSIDTKLEEATKELDKVTKSMDVGAVKQKIEDITSKKEELEVKLKDIDEEIASLHKHSSVVAEIELHKSALLSKEKELEDLKEKRESDVKMLLEAETLPSSNLKDKLENVQKQLLDQVKEITEEIKKEQLELTSLETTISHKEREMKSKLSEFESDKEKILSVCDYKDFDETLLLQSKKVKDLQDKRGMYAYQDVAYKEYLKQLKQKDPCCPLCHRHFTEEKKAKDLIEEMEGEMENHPNQLKKCEAELKAQQTKYDTMLQLKPIVEKVNRFEKTELGLLTDSMKEQNSQLTQFKTRIQDLEMLKIDPEGKLALYKDIVSDVVLWDRCTDDVERLNTTISDVESRLSNTSKHRLTMEEAQKERVTLNESLSEAREEIDSLQQQINAYNEKTQHARDVRNALQEDQLKIRSDMQKLKQLRDKQSELFVRENSLVAIIDSSRKKLEIATEELDSAALVLECTKKDHWSRQESERKTAENMRRRSYELQKLQDELESFTSKNIPEALSRSEIRVSKYEQALEELASDKFVTETELSKLKEDLSRQEIRKRELADTILLRKTEKNAEELKQVCADIKRDLDSINYKETQKEWQRLRHQEDELLRQKNIAKGNLEELERVIQQGKEEMKQDTYRLARQRLANKCALLGTQEQIISDYQTYSKILDKAMIQYHQERMATVNKIIQRMWRLVYSGTDTTSIQIRTDATEGLGGARRVYNYKLTQTKHGQEVDMRGRCSAGQRVLASIIIRLALAETFCKNCGILALDEPTTNLDEENANNLAEALSVVVQSRSPHQKNFQLIVISHDEKFLLKLAAINDNKGYYELYRKYNGHTAIKHCDVYGRETQINDLKEEVESSEEESDEEDEGIENGREPVEDDSVNKRRSNWDNSDEQEESRPSKKRFVLDI